MSRVIVDTATAGDVYVADACSGKGPCQVTMSAAKSVGTEFEAEAPIEETTPPTPRHTLTVSATGAGQGTVSSQPAGIDCGTDCANVYDQGAVLVLTANPLPGSVFAGWSGCDSVAGNRCTVTMSADQSVTATFDRAAGHHHHHRKHRHHHKRGRR